MACIITINVKGHKFTYTSSLDKGEVTLENIAKEIAGTNAGKLIDFSDKGVAKQGQSLGKALADAISSAESLTEQTTGIKQKFKEALDGKGGQILGNYMLVDLETRFPGIDFQGLSLDDDESILVCKPLDYGGLGLGNKVSTPDGSVYIIHSRRDAAKFAKYLRTRDKLRKEDSDFDAQLSELTEREQKAIDFIKEKTGIKSTQKALYHFFNKSDQYLTAVADGDIDVYSTLSDVIKEKVNKDYIRQRLENPIANSIMKRAFYADGKHIISNEEFLRIMDMFGIEEDFSDQNFLKAWLQTFMSDSGNPVNVKVSKKGNIFISLPYETMKDLDFTYEDIVLMKEEPMSSRGPFKVYNYKNNKYFVSQDAILTLDSRAQSFATKSEAEDYAAQRYNYTTIKDGYNRMRFGIRPDVSRSVSHFIDLSKTDGTQIVETKENFNPAVNTVFSVLDYELDSTKPLSELISSDLIKYLGKPLIGKGSLKEFLTKHKVSDEALDAIDSYDKALAVLVELSKLPTLTDEAIQNTVEAVGELPTYEFMVIAKNKYKDVNKLIIQRVSYTENSEDTYTPPVLPLLKNLAEEINNRFTIKTKNPEPLVYVITNSDITNGEYGLDTFQNVDRSARGFIYNGHIYINASYAHLDDLGHEFGHLFLGIMKAANIEQYTELMKTVSEMQQIRTLKEQKRSQPQYANLADEDLTEEAFVELFGNYLKGNNKKLGILLESQEQINANQEADAARVASEKAKGKLAEAKNFLTEALQVFGTSFEGAVTLNDIFNNFNIAMKSLLYQGNGLEFADTGKYRRVTNFISKELSKGDNSLIQMNC